jgi:hypothetical protein
MRYLRQFLAREAGMDIDTLMAAIRSIDKNNTVLVIVLCFSSVYLIREFMSPPTWLMILAGPSVLFAGFVGTGIMRTQSWFVSGEEAINTVIGTTSGIVVCFCIGAVLYRLTAEFSDETRSGPYKTKPKHKPPMRPII